VYSSGTLTYLPPHIRRDVFSNYKSFTRPGGLNAFNVFVEKPFLATPPDWGIDEHSYISGELLTYYWDWRSSDSKRGYSIATPAEFPISTPWM